MTKDLVFKISVILALLGLALLYWSGKISATTDGNWQGIVGILLSAFGWLGITALFASRIGK